MGARQVPDFTRAVTNDSAVLNATFINPTLVKPRDLDFLTRITHPTGWSKPASVTLVGVGQQGMRNWDNLRWCASKADYRGITKLVLVDVRFGENADSAQLVRDIREEAAALGLSCPVTGYSGLQAAISGSGITQAYFFAETTTERTKNLRVLMDACEATGTNPMDIAIESCGVEKPVAVDLPTVQDFYAWCKRRSIYADKHVGEVPFHDVGMTLPLVIQGLEDKLSAEGHKIESVLFRGMRGNNTEKLKGPRNLLQGNGGSVYDKSAFELTTAFNIFGALNNFRVESWDAESVYYPAVILTPEGELAYTRHGVPLRDLAEIEAQKKDVAEGAAYLRIKLNGRLPFVIEDYSSLTHPDPVWGASIEGMLNDTIREKAKARGLNPTINTQDEFRAAGIEVHTTAGTYNLGYRMIVPGRKESGYQPFSWFIAPDGKSDLIVASFPGERPWQQLRFVISVMDKVNGIERRPIVPPETALFIHRVQERAKEVATFGGGGQNLPFSNIPTTPYDYVDARTDPALCAALQPKTF